MGHSHLVITLVADIHIDSFEEFEIVPVKRDRPYMEVATLANKLIVQGSTGEEQLARVPWDKVGDHRKVTTSQNEVVVVDTAEGIVSRTYSIIKLIIVVVIIK